MLKIVTLTEEQLTQKLLKEYQRGYNAAKMEFANAEKEKNANPKPNSLKLGNEVEPLAYRSTVVNEYNRDDNEQNQ